MVRQTLHLEFKPDFEFTPESDAIRGREPAIPRGRLRQLMAAAQSGDHRAYRKFLEGASRHLDEHYTGQLLRSERERLIEAALSAIHDKRATCDPRLPARDWIEAIAEYRRKHGKPPATESNTSIELSSLRDLD